MARDVSAERRESRIRRHARARRRVAGTPERPRLAVYRSLQHIYAQIIDDEARRTLVAASSVEPTLSGELAGRPKKARAEAVGRAIAERARAAGIQAVVFDRGGNRYHGRVRALADAAREGGLEF
jgi:large subunit ribosomal protein L18